MTNLAHFIVTRMMENQPIPLDQVPGFVGAGIYAIYYAGIFPSYAYVSGRNRESAEVPIYVGKALRGGRCGGVDLAPDTTTRALSSRLRQHAASVRAATNLDIEDFSARWIVIDDIWIPLGESALIRRYRPIWNTVVGGFCNHDPGADRRHGIRSRWDTLHRGRAWVDDVPPRPESAADIDQETREYLRSRL
jgi:hypothetical protein